MAARLGRLDMKQYRQKPLYGATMIASAAVALFTASIYLSRAEEYPAIIWGIIAVIWAAYGIWSFRMTYLRIGKEGLTIRTGGLFSSERLVAWPDILAAVLNGKRLDLSTNSERDFSIRLSALRQRDREGFLEALAEYVDVA